MARALPAPRLEGTAFVSLFLLNVGLTRTRVPTATPEDDRGEKAEPRRYALQSDFWRLERRLKRTGPRPYDQHGPQIRLEFHDWAFVCIGSTVTTLRPDFRAPVARRVVGLRSQFRIEALVWPLSEGIRTRHCHLRHRVSPTEPGDRCESASLDIHTGEATMWFESRNANQ